MILVDSSVWIDYFNGKVKFCPPPQSFRGQCNQFMGENPNLKTITHPTKLQSSSLGK